MTKEQKYLLWLCRNARDSLRVSNGRGSEYYDGMTWGYMHSANIYSTMMFGRKIREWL